MDKVDGYIEQVKYYVDDVQKKNGVGGGSDVQFEIFGGFDQVGFVGK